MSDLDESLALYVTKMKEAKFLSDFLFNLTIGVRAIHILGRPDILKQLYGINQVFHSVMPFINLSIANENTSHTVSTLYKTIRDIELSYDIERYVDEAWITAQTSTRNQSS